MAEGKDRSVLDRAYELKTLMSALTVAIQREESLDAALSLSIRLVDLIGELQERILALAAAEGRNLRTQRP
jgi:hypothetical protein